MLRIGAILLTVVMTVLGSSLPHAQESEFSDSWNEEIFGGWMTEKPEPWQSQIEGLMPDFAAIVVIAYPPATRGSVRAQIMVSYLVMLAGIGGSELTSPMEAKLGLKFQDLEAQTKSWRKAILYGDDRKAAMLSAGIFTEVERSQVAKETGHLKLQKCWQKVFYCFQYESEMPLRKCEVLATQIFDRKTC